MVQQRLQDNMMYLGFSAAVYNFSGTCMSISLTK